MITIKITRKDRPDGAKVVHEFERSRVGKLFEDIAEEVKKNAALRVRINETLRTESGDLLDVYARNYVKDCWVKIMDMRTEIQ